MISSMILSKYDQALLKRFEGRDDESLIEDFYKGDKVAFTVLYCRYVGRILRYAKGFGLDHHMAEDAVDDIFSKIYQTRGRATSFKRRKGSFKSWLYKIARNHCIAVSDKTGREVIFSEFDRADEETSEWADGFIANIADEAADGLQEFEVWQGEVLNAVSDCMNTLTVQEREAMELILEFEPGPKKSDRSKDRYKPRVEDVANTMGISVTGAHKFMKLATGKMKACLRRKGIIK